MKRFVLLMIIFFVMDVFFNPRVHAQQSNVLTHHNDIYRTGVTSSETSLQPANVNARSFGKLFARRVIGQIWGQPLYVRGVPVGGRLVNVVYVATSENWVYGFDADNHATDEATPPIMSIFLGAPAGIGTDFSFHTIFPSNGISGTPVIDLGNPPSANAGTLYVVAKLKQDNKFHIFALDLRSLAIRPNSAGQKTGVIISATAHGQGDASLSFDNSDHLNRPALLISNGHLILAFGSGPRNDGDAPNFNGWVISYSLPNLIQTGVFITTPSNTGMGGIWQSGNGPAADDQGNIFFLTGNGTFQSAKGRADVANAFVKLANPSLALLDWYAPPSRDVLAACDLDLGSSGPAVIENSGKVLGVGKSGIVYVLDKDRLGKTDTLLTQPANWRGTPDCTIGQCFRVAENEYQPAEKTKLPCPMKDFSDDNGSFSTNWNTVLNSYPHVHGAPVVWSLDRNRANMYVWPEQDFLKAFHFDGQKFSTAPVASSAPYKAAMMSMPGAVMSLSWNGIDPSTGIIWTARPDPEPKQFAASAPFVSAFVDQQHFAFQGEDGIIWDSYYAQSDNQWHFQQVNFTGIPSAAGAPFVSVFADQQHFAYLNPAGTIWDAFYARGNPPLFKVDKWNFQQINTHGHRPAGGIFVSTFHDQQHFVWKDATGRIWDSFYVQSDSRWHFQEINTGGHPAAGSVFVSVFNSADQQHFAYADQSGNIWDAFYRRGQSKWDFQQINTHGHPASGNLFISVFDSADQQHFAYTDRLGNIWDAFYRRGQNQWDFQPINTHGHRPAGGIFVSAFHDQQHFVWKDGSGRIWDSFYAQADNHWHFQEINTSGHPAASNIFVSVFGAADQQHFAYTDQSGNIWDAFYIRGQNKWSFQQINTAFNCMAPSGADLTPNAAPCNAINKIVRGVLEAFNATPGFNNQLTELWNSKVKLDNGFWFAKQSPPTIADGKVFLAEFPPPVPGGYWSDSRAYGRLVVYSLH